MYLLVTSLGSIKLIYFCGHNNKDWDPRK